MKFKKLLYFIIITISLIGAFIASQLNALILIIALFLSFYSAKYAIISISLSWLLTTLNPGLFPDIQLSAVLKQGIYFSALAGVCWRWFEFGDRGLIKKDIFGLLLFAFYVIMSSLFTSYYPDVSILKVILFTIGIASIILCFRELTEESLKDIEDWFIVLFLVITVFSLPFIFNSLGYTRNGRGFQGILDQPQIFGTFYAVVIAFVTGRMWQFKEYKLLYVLITVLGIAYIFLSEARTGLLGLLLSFSLALIFTLRTSVKKIFFDKKIIIPLILLCIFAIPFQKEIVSGITEFLLKADYYEQIKGSNLNQLDESLEQSRGAFFYASLENFISNPIFGNGFGIASNPTYMDVLYDPIFDKIPVSAPIEKGVSPMALLEENGVIGSLIFVLFLYFLVRKLFNRSMFYLIWPLMAVFAINFGEATIFSFNNHAGLYWLIIMHHVILEKKGDNITSKNYLRIK